MTGEAGVQVKREIVIKDASIRLGQLLKLAGMAGTGGEAKQIIQAGEVKVNGLVETKRGRQLIAGDEVQLAGRLVVVRGKKDVR